MPREAWLNDGGVARRRRQRWFNDGGVARRIRERWVNDNGVARCIWREAEVRLLDGTYRSNTNFGTAVFSLEAQGTIFHSAGPGSGPTQSAWITPQDGMSEYQARATRISQTGVGSFSGVYNSWLSLGTVERAWIANRPSSAGPGADTLVFDVSIRRAVDQIVLATARITLISQG